MTRAVWHALRWPLRRVRCARPDVAPRRAADGGGVRRAVGGRGRPRPRRRPARCRRDGGAARRERRRHGARRPRRSATRSDDGRRVVGMRPPHGGGRGSPPSRSSTATSLGARASTSAPTLGDAPPPRLVRAGTASGGGYAAAEADPPSSTRASSLLRRVGAGGDAERRSPLRQQRDDSLALDLGRRRSSRGTRRRAGRPARGGARRRLRPTTPARRATRPRPTPTPRRPALVPGGAGYFVALDRAPPGARGHAGRGARRSRPGRGAARSSWLEMVPVDAAGRADRARCGGSPRRRATSSAYDVLALPRATAAPTLLVVAATTARPWTAPGARSLRVRVREDGAGSARRLPDRRPRSRRPELRRRASPLAWLAWVGPHEEARLLPLDADGRAGRPAERRAALDEARPLAMLRLRTGGRAAGTPADARRFARRGPRAASPFSTCATADGRFRPGAAFDYVFGAWHPPPDFALPASIRAAGDARCGPIAQSVRAPGS